MAGALSHCLVGVTGAMARVRASTSTQRIVGVVSTSLLQPRPNTCLSPPDRWRNSADSPSRNDKPSSRPRRGPSAGPWSYTQPRLETLLSAGMTGGRRIALLWWPGYCLVGVAGASPEAGRCVIVL